MFEQDITIHGKHAGYLKFLAKSKNPEDRDNPKGAEIYSNYIDVYKSAPIFGLRYKRQADRDLQSKDTANILAGALNTERDNLIFVYRLVMLLDETTNLTPEQRIDRAFRFDASNEENEEFKQNMELFNSYVRGGIEIMYERFTDSCSNRDEYIDKTFEVMSNYKNEIEGISEEKLNEIINK